MPDRIPFNDVAVGEKITFDSGYYMTGEIVANVGRYSGKRMVEFREEGATVSQYISYACHRSVRRA